MLPEVLKPVNYLWASVRKWFYIWSYGPNQTRCALKQHVHYPQLLDVFPPGFIRRSATGNEVRWKTCNGFRLQSGAPSWVWVLRQHMQGLTIQYVDSGKDCTKAFRATHLQLTVCWSSFLAIILPLLICYFELTSKPCANPRKRLHLLMGGDLGTLMHCGTENAPFEMISEQKANFKVTSQPVLKGNIEVIGGGFQILMPGVELWSYQVCWHKPSNMVLKHEFHQGKQGHLDLANKYT